MAPPAVTAEPNETHVPDGTTQIPGLTAGPGRCESCGGFIGPYERCPYCGARSRGRLSIRAIKIASVLMATLGLVALWALARTQEIPTVSTSDATAMMNLAYVRLEGHVSRNLSYDPESGYLAFWLGDESGEIYVSAYREVTEALIEQGSLPAIGDKVSVAGTLRIREDMTSLTLNVPQHVTFDRPPAQALKIKEITLLDAGTRVRIAGEVRATRVPYEDLTIIEVADESGEIDVAVDGAIRALTGPLPEITAGQGITVEGCVTLYRATPQITLGNVKDVQLAPAPPAPDAVPLRSLSELQKQPLGGLIRVQGHVVFLEGLRGGVKATLDDGTAQVALLLWDDVYGTLGNPKLLDIGAEVEASGELAIYEGELEVIPGTADDIVILTPAEPVPWVEAGQLTSTDAGRTVRLRGVLGKPEGFSAGVKLPLDDGTGEITLLLWSNLYESLSPQPQAGQMVEVAGILDVYRGELELVPRSIYDWRVRPPDD